MKKKIYIDVKEEVINSARTPVEMIWEGKRYMIGNVIMHSLTECSDGSRAIPCKCYIKGKYRTLWMDGDKWFVEAEIKK